MAADKDVETDGGISPSDNPSTSIDFSSSLSALLQRAIIVVVSVVVDDTSASVREKRGIRGAAVKSIVLY